MPLEALYSLMVELVKDPDALNVLNGVLGARTLVLVAKDLFQSKPLGIDASKLSDNVFAFCILVRRLQKIRQNSSRLCDP